MQENKELIINWSKFKNNSKGATLISAKSSYIKFCKTLNEVGFELVGDYIGSVKKTQIMYNLEKRIKLNISPDKFKRTHKSIINFQKELIKNGDEFIKFIDLTDSNFLVAQIKTFDGGIVNINISAYNKWNKGRRDFYSKLKEINGYTTDFYKDNNTKISIFVDSVRLNDMHTNNFKRSYKAVINFKNDLSRNNDKLIKFVGLNGKNFLIAKIKTFDGGVVELDIASYNHWNKGRRNTYDYCKKNGYKILSPYINSLNKILIDFNCGHDSHWILSNSLKKGHGCPMCDESKGEKAIRMHLENHNINFIQEYRFDDCKYKITLPFDFYIPEYNLCIEFDGEQHYKALKYFGGKEKFKLTQIRDKIKNNYCRENNINLLRIPYWELDEIEEILDEVMN